MPVDASPLFSYAGAEARAHSAGQVPVHETPPAGGRRTDMARIAINGFGRIGR